MVEGLRDRLEGGFSISNGIGLLTLAVVIGMWAGGLNSMDKNHGEGLAAMKEQFRVDLARVENQILIWEDDAEKKAAENQAEIMKKLDTIERFGMVRSGHIKHVDNFLKRMFPNEYNSLD